MEIRAEERQEGGQDDLLAVPDAPMVPEAVREAARRAPGHWVGVVDPEWDADRTPPEWAVLGEWRSDADGGVWEYRPNAAYRPSARVLGWPEPTDPVDAAAQRAATGYGTVGEALAELAGADVSVVRGPDGGPLMAAGRDGVPVALLFTSPTHAFMSSALHHDSLPATELARAVSASGALLMVNAGAAAPLLVPADSLPGAMSAADGPSSTEPWPHTTGSTP
ncbi:type VII secretion system-associated protein [Streptomyces sp. NPDC101178]|uniref:type VII secretion system-associated protein n=1 Tax=Streptomyces sp. NPDC101178 TaxID=3366124 RepID=UPI00380CA538